MQRSPYLPAIAPPSRTPQRSIRVAGRAGIALALAAVAGCAGGESLPGITPPHTDVPAVAADQFPTVGTTPAPNRAPALTPQAQQKLQQDLERLARTQQAKRAQPDQN